MKALRVRDLPSGDWLCEMKFDGYRALAFKARKEVRRVSRNRIDFGNNYPQLVDALKSLRSKNCIIDGEIAALDPHSLFIHASPGDKRWLQSYPTAGSPSTAEEWKIEIWN